MTFSETIHTRFNVTNISTFDNPWCKYQFVIFFIHHLNLLVKSIKE